MSVDSHYKDYHWRGPPSLLVVSYTTGFMDMYSSEDARRIKTLSRSWPRWADVESLAPSFLRSSGRSRCPRFHLVVAPSLAALPGLFVCLYMFYRLLYNKLVFSRWRRNHSYSYMNLIVSLANLNGPPLQEHKLGKAWPDRGCLPLNGIQVKK